MADGPYTRTEMHGVGSELPECGPVCPTCGVHIPHFADVTDSDGKRVRKLITDQQPN